MKTHLLLATLLLMGLSKVGSTQQIGSKIGQIKRLDHKLDSLIDVDETLEIIGEGYDWAEGPVWIEQEQCLLFSDVPNNVVHRWTKNDGVTRFLEPAGFTGPNARGGETGSNGLALDAQQRLLLCQHGDRRVALLESDLKNPRPSYKTVVDRFDGKRLNSPNDLAVHSSGAIYFTDPPYGLEKQAEDLAKEIDFQGVYRWDGNSLRLLTDKLTRPNGIAFSPDESIAYVAVSDSARPIWMKYEVQDDGSFDDGVVFFDASSLKGKGLPDGLKVDLQGNVWATGPGGVSIFSPQGKHLGTIETTQATANCCFGEDGSTLFVTADMFLLRVRTGTTGCGHW